MQHCTRTLQMSRYAERGQTVFREYLTGFDGKTAFYHSVAAAGALPAGGAVGTDVAYLRMPDGITGRILRFGAVFTNQGIGNNLWAGGDTAGTLSLDVLPLAGAAFANIANIVWPGAGLPLPANAVPNDAVYENTTVTLAGGTPPYVYAGGSLFAAYISVARVVAAGGVQGECVSFVDFTIDTISPDASAAVAAYLLAL